MQSRLHAANESTVFLMFGEIYLYSLKSDVKFASISFGR